MKIVVLGAGGQLGQTFHSLASEYDSQFEFWTRAEFDLSKTEEFNQKLSESKADVCINCAAYTAVDKAEEDVETAKLINEIAPGHLADVCNQLDIKLVHYSTDFVFDGTSSEPYTEEDKVQPLGVYGQTKLNGEKAILDRDPNAIIIRTSWVYSEFGHNFLKTMLRLGADRPSLNVVFDQVGTPTYTGDLVKATMKLLSAKNEHQIYHFSNEGVTSWYDFARQIFEISNLSCDVSPIRSAQYPTPAKRPSFSVLDKARIKEELEGPIPHWQDSLKVCLEKLKDRA